MATIVEMPRLGATMTEGTIEKWLKNGGDWVNKGHRHSKLNQQTHFFPGKGFERRRGYAQKEDCPRGSEKAQGG